MGNNCNYCGVKLKPHKRRFCCNKHKDKYHNENNPRGIYAHLNPDNPNYDIEADHPFSMDGTNWGGAKD